MTNSSKLMLAALVSGVALSAASGEAPVQLQRGIAARPGAPGPAEKAPASDPAEPPLKVEVSYSSPGAGGPGVGGMAPRGIAVRGPGAAAGASSVSVATGAKGTTLTLSTPGSYRGTGKLTFKNSAPPMRLTLRLEGMPNQDLGELTLGSGALKLAVGAVGAGPTTRYFDARGKAQEADSGAAYTVTARRRGDGTVDVLLRRSPGAALGKELTLSWGAGVGVTGDFDRLIRLKQ